MAELFQQESLSALLAQIPYCSLQIRCENMSDRLSGFTCRGDSGYP